MAEAKLAILVTSVVAGAVGYFYLRWYTRRDTAAPDIVPEAAA